MNTMQSDLLIAGTWRRNFERAFVRHHEAARIGALMGTAVAFFYIGKVSAEAERRAAAL